LIGQVKSYNIKIYTSVLSVMIADKTFYSYHSRL